MTLKKLAYLCYFMATSFLLNSCGLLSASGLSSQGQPVKQVDGKLASTNTAIVNHNDWDILLKKYVDKNGNVNYKDWANNKEPLKKYLTYLSANEPQDSWPTAELLAYYINTYNAYTVDLILDNYPLKSIKDISGPWTKAIIPIGNKKISLGGLENSILRKMNEPRIHFAINCASISCPKLLNEAYFPETLEAQLDLVTRQFINSDKNEISANQLKLSNIFNWYEKDFIFENSPNLVAYIQKYTHKKMLINPEATVTFLEYNWNLNEVIE